MRLQTLSLSLRWRRYKPAAACSYCSHIFLLFHAFSCFFCFLMLLWSHLKNRDDWNICLKTVSGGLHFFFSNRSIGFPPNIAEGHVLASQFYQATTSRKSRKSREKQEKAGKSTEQQEGAAKRRKSKTENGGRNTQGRETLSKKCVFALFRIAFTSFTNMHAID